MSGSLDRPAPNLGMQRNWHDVIDSGKYVALLEGDDYWTDRHKLNAAGRVSSPPAICRLLS